MSFRGVHLLLILIVAVLFAGVVFAANEKNVSISVSKLRVDSYGNGILSLQNDSKQPITIQKVVVNGNDFVFNDVIAKKSKMGFYLTYLDDLCTAKNPKKTKNARVAVSFIDQSGQIKVMATTNPVTCVKKLNPKNPSNIAGLGLGTLASPWVINSCKELQGINAKLDGNYALAGNIDCSNTQTWNNGAGFSPIGTSTNGFNGSLSGAGKIISGLYIFRPLQVDVGLFGYQNSFSSVRNVGLADANVTGGNNVGGFFGICNGDGALNSNLFVTGKFIAIYGVSNPGWGCGASTNPNGGDTFFDDSSVIQELGTQSMYGQG